MGDELGLSNSSVGIAIGAFAVSGTIVRPFVGRGIDRRGRRPFLLSALALLSLTSLRVPRRRHLALVVVLRLLQGVASAGYYTAAAAAATDLAPTGRAKAIARFSLFLYAGFALGPAVGEQLIDAAGFGPTWILAAALGAAGFAFIWALPETGGESVAHRRATSSVGRRRLLHPAALGPGLVLLATSVGYSGITRFSKLYAREIGLDSAGALYIVFAVTIIGLRLTTGHLADRHPKSHVVLPGLGCAVAGLVLLAVVQQPVAAYLGVAAFGAGHALIFPPLMAFTVDRVGDPRAGRRRSARSRRWPTWAPASAAGSWAGWPTSPASAWPTACRRASSWAPPW